MTLRAFILSLFLVLSARAQDASLTVEVDATTVAAGEQFEVAFTFAGGGMSTPSNFKAPDWGSFVVISGPNTSQSMQIINGRGSVTVSYGFVLYARQSGTFTIGPASVEFKGSTLRSQAVKITVTQGKPAPKPGAGSNNASVGDNILIRASADRQRVRLGEQVTVTWKVYTRVGMSISRVSKLPTYEGFWGEDFELPKQTQLVTEVYEGKQYRAAVIKKTALFPSQTGALKVGPMELTAAVQMQSKKKSNDPFDQFFNDPFFQGFQTVEMDFASNPLTINVDPLPAGAPAGFTNAVGTYAFTASVDKNEVRAGDAITLRMTVKGSGNIKLVQLPKPAIPADIESFEPKVTDDITRDGGVIRGSKTAEYVLVPRNAGDRAVEPMTFSYYDPDRRSYVSLRSQRFALKILPGRELAMSVGASQADVRMLGQDIRFVKITPGDLLPTGARGLFGWGSLALLLLPPLAFAGVFAYRKRMEKVYGDLPTLRFERAGREASRRLKQARALLAQGNAEQYHAEVLRALSGYLEHKLRLEKASLSADEILARLTARGVPGSTANDVRACLEKAEFARYAPGADSRGGRQDLLDAAGRAIDDIERTYKA